MCLGLPACRRRVKELSLSASPPLSPSSCSSSSSSSSSNVNFAPCGTPRPSSQVSSEGYCTSAAAMRRRRRLAAAAHGPCSAVTMCRQIADARSWPLLLMPHASCLMPHASCLMPHASCLMLMLLMPHAPHACLMHASCMCPHASCMPPQLRCLRRCTSAAAGRRCLCWSRPGSGAPPLPRAGPVRRRQRGR